MSFVMKLAELDEYHRKKRWESWEKEYSENLKEEDKKFYESYGNNSGIAGIIITPWERDKFGLRNQEMRTHCRIKEIIYRNSWDSAAN